MNEDQGCNTCEPTIEEACAYLRKEIEVIKAKTVAITKNSQFNNEDESLANACNLPGSRNGNMKANLTLVFRHLEDARMRLGKVMQAYQGGTSILDK